MNWTQPICRACYAAKEPGHEPCCLRPEYCDDRRCCLCGRHTHEGIFYRVDPRTVPYPQPEEAE